MTQVGGGGFDLLSRLGHGDSLHREARIEIEELRRNLDLRNEQIDGYERQLGIDQAGAERTIGSEIDRLLRNKTHADSEFVQHK